MPISIEEVEAVLNHGTRDRILNLLAADGDQGHGRSVYAGRDCDNIPTIFVLAPAVSPATRQRIRHAVPESVPVLFVDLNIQLL